MTWLNLGWLPIGVIKRTSFNKTPKNTPSARVFADLGFDERNVEGDSYVFEYPDDKDMPADDIVEIERAD